MSSLEQDQDSVLATNDVCDISVPLPDIKTDMLMGPAGVRKIALRVNYLLLNQLWSREQS